MLDRGFLVQAGVSIFPGWKDLKVSGLPASHAFRVKSLIIEQTRITFFHFSWKLLAPISFAGSSCIVFSRAEKNLLHNSSVALRDKVATNYGNVIHLLHSPLSFHFFVLLIRWRDSELFTGLTFVLLNHGEFFWFEYSCWNEKAEMTLHCWNQRPLYNVPQQTTWPLPRWPWPSANHVLQVFSPWIKVLACRNYFQQLYLWACKWNSLWRWHVPQHL